MYYFELIANSHGIGTLWNGMIKWTIDDINPELRALIGIPKDHTIWLCDDIWQTGSKICQRNSIGRVKSELHKIGIKKTLFFTSDSYNRLILLTFY